MRIIFTRHGQTDWNILGKVQGTTDIELNETGIQQAMELCDNLMKNNIHPEKVYSSTQKRARKTSEIIADTFQIPMETVHGLEEMNLGDFEGHTWDEIRRLYPKEMEHWFTNKRYIKTPNGESYQIVLERVFQALESILEKERKVGIEDKDIVVVTHGAVIMSLLALHRDIRFEEAHNISIGNAEPFIFSMEEIDSIRKKL